MRKHSLDICRILACLLVVMIHTVMLFWDFDPSSPTWAVYNFIAVVIRCGVPLFFMLSGALILGREQLDAKKHCFKILHFLLLYFVWSFICAFTDKAFFHVWYQQGEAISLFLSSYYHLWYLPAMIMCYCCIPLLYKLINRNAAISMAQAMIFAAFSVILYLLLPEAFDIANLRYLVYTLLGWYLYAHSLSGKKIWLLAIASVFAVIVFSALNRRYSISIGEASTKYYDYMSIAMLLLSSFVFSLCLHIKSVPRKLCPVVEEFSACTLGIYLLHPLFISALKSLQLDFTRFSTFVFFPLCYFSFVSLSFTVSFVLRRIPIAKKLVS